MPGTTGSADGGRFEGVTAVTRKVMQANKGKDTKPEMIVRRLLHGLGYRYRVHAGSLPGRPDIVFPGRRRILFVHGCFWHRHLGCRRAFMPKTRAEFWAEKFQSNVNRDARNMTALEEAGWQVRVIWECETREPEDLSRNLVEFLGPARSSAVSSDV